MSAAPKRAKRPLDAPAYEWEEEGPAAALETAAEATPMEHDEIARRAYLHWQQRGCPDGSPEVDWAWAEEKLRQ
jgi:hypothetical protein